MKTNGLTNFLFSHASAKPASFHTPGHKGAKFYKRNGFGKFIKNAADYDIAEIPGADTLFMAEGVIEETQEKYSDLYEAERSYLLINGTGSGLIAAVLATVPEGGKLIMARNCHKAVFDALDMGAIKPIYVYPDMIDQYGIPGAISPEEIEQILEANPDASAVILSSPNESGICSDIKAISCIVHNYGKVLIVDQSYGAHLKFFSSFGLRRPIISRPGGGKVASVDVRKGAEAQAEYYKNHGTGQSLGEKGWKWNMPLPAEECGADIVVNGTYATLGSLKQSGVMNVMAEAFSEAGGHIAEVDSGYLVEDPTSEFAKDHTKYRVDISLLEDRLRAVQSSDPSYLLMGSLDVNAEILDRHGRKLFAEWRRNIIWFYRKAATIPELRVVMIEAEEKSIIAEAADKSIKKLKKMPWIRDTKFGETEEPRRQSGSLDATKIIIELSAYNIDGEQLEKMLNDKGIYPEYSFGKYVVCVTGIGNRRKDYKRLYKALGEIAYANRGSLIKLAHDERIEHDETPELPERIEGNGANGNGAEERF
ncbi:MAG: hypothetical protein Q4A65_07350 [Bacillota bacterium]|nr:hypothetical protein [Bacillota bacterium]